MTLEAISLEVLGLGVGGLLPLDSLSSSSLIASIFTVYVECYDHVIIQPSIIMAPNQDPSHIWLPPLTFSSGIQRTKLEELGACFLSHSYLHGRHILNTLDALL